MIFFFCYLKKNKLPSINFVLKSFVTKVQLIKQQQQQQQQQQKQRERNHFLNAETRV